MMVRYFEWQSNHDDGEGWVPLFMHGNVGPTTYPAHDILEHRPGDDPTMEEEMMAVGRIIYTRAITGWYSRKCVLAPSPEYSMGNDIGFFMRREHDEGRRLGPAPRSVNLLRLPSNVADLIVAIVKQARKSLWEEAGANGHEWRRKALIPRAERQMMRDWLALGYIDARKRYYEAGDPYEIHLLYEEINNTCQKLRDGHDGELLRCMVSLKGQRFRLERGYNDDRGRFCAH